MYGPTTTDTNHIYLRSDEGIITVYTLNSGSFQPPPGDTSTLTQNSGNYVLTNLDGSSYTFNSSGNLVLVKDRYNNQTRLSYTNGDLTQITDARGRSITLVYDTSATPHRLTSIKDPAQNTYDIQYQNGRLWKVLNPPATTGADRGYWEYAYTSKDLLESKRDPNNNTTHIYYFDDLRVQRSTDPNERPRSLSYDPPVGSLLTTTFTEKDLNPRTYVYDIQLGLLKSKTDANGKTTSFTYYANKRLKSKTVPFDGASKFTTFYIYDDNGNLTGETDPLDLSLPQYAGIDPATVDTSAFTATSTPIAWARNYTYDTAANFYQIKTATDNRGTSPLTTTYDRYTEPDGQGGTWLVTKTTAPNESGNPTLISYQRQNANGTIASTTDANNKTTAFTYYPVDSSSTSGMLHTITTPDNIKLTYTAYDGNGNATEFRLTDDHNVEIPVKTTQGYDALNRIASVLKESTATPAGFLPNLTQYGYDNNGNMNSLTDAEGHVTTYEHTYQGQVKKITNTVNSLPLVTEFQYGGTGCPSCNGVDKLTAVRDPNHVKNSLPGTLYQYDKVGNLEYETDPVGKKLRHTYYDNGLIKQTYDVSAGEPGTLRVSYLYNNRGQLADRNYPDGTGDHFTYNANGWLLTAANQNITYTFEYYANGRLKSVIDNKGSKISYDQYDAIGQRKKVTHFPGTAGEHVNTYSYDAANRLWRINVSVRTNSPDTSGLSSNFDFAYDERGRRRTLTYPNQSVATYGYDDLDRLKTVTHTYGVRGIASFEYNDRDQVGNIKTVTGSRSATYIYDEIYRLLNVTATNAESFTYDDVGNRKTGPGAGDTGYQYNDSNQLTCAPGRTYTYDNFGNQATGNEIGPPAKAWTNTWDYANRLVRMERTEGIAQKVITFKYDPFGRRIEKKLSSIVDHSVTGDTFTYTYDGEDIIREIHSICCAGALITNWYVHGPGIDEPLALDREEGRPRYRTRTWYYYHADALGSIVAVTQNNGTVIQSYDYDSFGNLMGVPTFDQPYAFTGRECDKETGLYYYRARYYDPMEGRFISKDPIGFKGGINLYAYVQNNPINWMDPSGLIWVTVGTDYQGAKNTLIVVFKHFVYADKGRVGGTNPQTYEGGTRDTIQEWQHDPENPCRDKEHALGEKRKIRQTYIMKPPANQNELWDPTTTQYWSPQVPTRTYDNY